MTRSKGFTTKIVKASSTVAKGNLLKVHTDGTVLPCAAATDVALYAALEAGSAGEEIPVAILGVLDETILVLSGGAVAVGNPVTPEAKAATADGALFCGRALTAATDAGEMIEVAACVAGTLSVPAAG